MSGRPRKERRVAPPVDPEQEQSRQQALGAWVRAAREERGWSQRDLAAVAGCAPETIAGLERGQVDPRLSTLCRIAAAFDIALRSLCDAATVPVQSASTWADNKTKVHPT